MDDPRNTVRVTTREGSIIQLPDVSRSSLQFSLRHGMHLELVSLVSVSGVSAAIPVRIISSIQFGEEVVWKTER